MTTPVTIIPVEGLPEIGPGDDLAALIAGAIDLLAGDVVVVAQKVVSKAENALVALPDTPAGVDPRRVVARAQAAEIVADAPWALIVRTKHGLVCANAGVDGSNVAEGMLSLLPDDPDDSARRLRIGLRELTGADVAVVVSDTFGRPWRLGQTDVAIGVAGLSPLRDERGATDRNGRTLDVTESAVADELAGAADLVRTKAAGVPVVVIRGWEWTQNSEAAAAQLVREPSTDLFARGRGMLAAALAEDAWPSTWSAGAGEEEVAAARRVAPDLTVETPGPPTALRIADPLTAGLAAAVLADLGLRVRWRRDAGGVVLESGRTAVPG